MEKAPKLYKPYCKPQSVLIKITHREVVGQVDDHRGQEGILVGMVVRGVVYHLVLEVHQIDQELGHRPDFESHRIYPKLQGHLRKG